jgi:hypothetical protein
MSDHITPPPKPVSQWSIGPLVLSLTLRFRPHHRPTGFTALCNA